MTSPLFADPALEAFLRVTDELIAPGGLFEVAKENVLEQAMLVFRKRSRSLREILVRADTHGDRDCFVFSDGRRITFTEIPRQVASVAAYLRDERNIGRGDRVAICAANGAGWLLTMWALASLGAVNVAMNGWWTELEMRHALDLTEPKLLLADAKRSARLGATPGLGRLDIDADLDVMLAHDPAAELPADPIDEDDPAMLVFTSGTTGRPKAAVLTHRVIIAFSMEQMFIGMRMAALGTAPAPVGPVVRLAVFPLFHISGLSAPVSSVLGGTTTVWPLGRFDAGEVIELTVQERINVWSGTATHILRLLDHPDVSRVDPRQLLQVSMGGSATTPHIVRRSDERFPHLRGTLSSGYGSTETGGLVSFAPNWMLAAAPDCVGPPLPTVEVRITDEGGTVLPEDRDGHICVRSPLVMPGYWRHDEANAEVFDADRWYRTGDFGRMAGGLLFIASRLRDLIIRGGENIYPFEIENRLEEHPDVLEVAVFGVDHDELGQEVKAVVVVMPGAVLTVADVREHCAVALSSYKIPSHVELRTDPLPRNATGKVMKQVLSGEGENTFIEE